jgi:hypothetical protein
MLHSLAKILTSTPKLRQRMCSGSIVNHVDDITGLRSSTGTRETYATRLQPHGTNGRERWIHSSVITF